MRATNPQGDVFCLIFCLVNIHWEDDVFPVVAQPFVARSLRPDDVLPDPDGPISARVSRKAFKGADIMYTLTLPSGTTLLSLFSSHDNFAVGDHVRVRLNVDHLVVFAIENTVAESMTSSPD